MGEEGEEEEEAGSFVGGAMRFGVTTDERRGDA